MFLCLKCNKMTAEKDLYTDEIVCYNAVCYEAKIIGGSKMKTCRGCGSDCGLKLIGHFYYCDECLGGAAEVLEEIKGCIGEESPCEVFCDQGCSSVALDDIREMVDYDYQNECFTIEDHIEVIEKINTVFETCEDSDKSKCDDCDYHKICAILER